MEVREDNKKGNELRSPTKEPYRDMQFYGLPYVPLLRKNPSFHDGYHYRSMVHEIAGFFNSLDLSKLVILYILPFIDSRLQLTVFMKYRNTNLYFKL